MFKKVSTDGKQRANDARATESLQQVFKRATGDVQDPKLVEPYEVREKGRRAAFKKAERDE